MCGAERGILVLVMPGSVGVVEEAVVREAVCVSVSVVSWEVGEV